MLALTRKNLNQLKYPIDYPFNGEELNFPTKKLCLIGFASLLDPPRPEVAEAINKCHDAGIRVTMITGDHPGTGMENSL